MFQFLPILTLNDDFGEWFQNQIVVIKGFSFTDSRLRFLNEVTSILLVQGYNHYLYFDDYKIHVVMKNKSSSSVYKFTRFKNQDLV